MNAQNLKNLLRAGLIEDGAFDDITTRPLGTLIKKPVQAVLISRNRGVFCGSFLLSPLFKILHPSIHIKILKKDGDRVKSNTRLAIVTGPAWAILAGERLFLNLACHLSGVATLTRSYVDKVRGTKASVYDTRKTTPLWRELERFAVRCGGGKNHRFSLTDAILVKDNHLKIMKNNSLNLGRCYKMNFSQRMRKSKFFEVEASNLLEVRQALDAGADIILLDNMKVGRIKSALRLIGSYRYKGRKRPKVEVSGGVSLENIQTFAKCGVDRISVGALTHSAPILDLSLEII